MIAFSSLPVFWQTLLPLLLLIEAVLELGLFLYQTLRRNKPVHSLSCLAGFTVLVILLFSITQGDPDKGKDAFLLDAPWLLFVISSILAAIHFAIALTLECHRHKNELSPFSIQEATDKLPMGICFADPDGRIILCNDRMRHLSFSLCGHELQVTKDLERALTQPDKSVTVKDDCYILPDLTVWQFRTQSINVDCDNGWQQVTAHNVTELYNENQRRTEINKELKEVNHKLQRMYERMADDIKEKESLDLKVHVHDAIGRSLLTIRDMLDSNADTERKIAALQEAINMLASNRVAAPDTMEEVKQTAKALGISVKTEGYLPPGSTLEELIAAAAKECVTNCIRHAGGNEVYIRIANQNDRYDITITSNGTAPTGPIQEGSGLSSLRHSIESSGGEMHTAYKPCFALLITLSGKENDL